MHNTLTAAFGALLLLAAPAHADPLQAVLTRAALGKRLPALARSAKKDLDRIARHYQRRDTRAGDAEWQKLARRLFTKRNKQQAASVINYVLYRAHIAPRPKLARVAARLSFYHKLRLAALKQRTRLKATLRTMRKGQKVRVKITTFTTKFRVGVADPGKTERTETADRAALERRMAEQQSVMDQAIEEAKQNYKDAREQFKLALRILSEHMERMTQVTQKITS
jgi:hypothetical protein